MEGGGHFVVLQRRNQFSCFAEIFLSIIWTLKTSTSTLILIADKILHRNISIMYIFMINPSHWDRWSELIYSISMIVIGSQPIIIQGSFKLYSRHNNDVSNQR